MKTRNVRRADDPSHSSHRPRLPVFVTRLPLAVVLLLCCLAAKCPPVTKLVDGTGFGNPNNTGFVSAYGTSTDLYVGSWNNPEGAIVYRSSDGSNFEPISAPGFGVSELMTTVDILAFGDHLYVGTWAGSGGAGAGLHRAPLSDPTQWEAITTDGFESANLAVTHLEAHKGMLYAGLFNPSEGPEVWRSATGDPGDWEQVNENGFMPPPYNRFNSDATALLSVGDYLYVGTEAWYGGWPFPSATQLWRTDGETLAGAGPELQWDQVNLDGYDGIAPDWPNYLSHANTVELAEFDGYLYAITWNYQSGSSIFRAPIASIDPLTPDVWEEVVTGGHGDPAYVFGGGIVVYRNQLYATMGGELGNKLLRSADGTTWTDITASGFGATPNSWALRMGVFKNRLFIPVASINHSAPGELWSHLAPP